MNTKQTRLHILHQPENLSRIAKTGVSMHCHTRHSKEMLDFIPYYAERIPVVSYFWRRECARYLAREGKKLPNFSTGYWLPPLIGEEVFDSEKQQMNRAGLDAIVSITDHDSIAANLEINERTANAQAPISMEWTVPFQYAFLHVGVHNLPPDRAAAITAELLAYTAETEFPDDEKLREIFALLNEIPEVLVVLNHPIWDIEMIGDALHWKLLGNFLAEHGRWLHALEVNGFRSWSENKAVIEMAETLGFPLVTGGDRHCCHANTVINLTDAKTFAEFAEEIRVDKYSQIALLPEYREPLAARQIASIAQILHNYPQLPEERRRWIDRVHVDAEDGGGVRPLSAHWQGGGPHWLRRAMRTVGVLSHKSIRPLFRLTMKKEDVVPRQSNVRRRFAVSGAVNHSELAEN